MDGMGIVWSHGLGFFTYTCEDCNLAFPVATRIWDLTAAPCPGCGADTPPRPPKRFIPMREDGVVQEYYCDTCGDWTEIAAWAAPRLMPTDTWGYPCPWCSELMPCEGA